MTTFNKQPPPSFRGFRDDLPLRVYQRHLPHWRQAGATYAVTFRLADSIPQDKLRLLSRYKEEWELQHPEPRSNLDHDDLYQKLSQMTERYMDQGLGSCLLRQPQFAQMMSEALLHFQNKRHHTACFTVMPNHVHVVLKPLADFELEDCLQRIKQFVSTHVNKAMRQSGPLWAEESYDRIVRDEEHLWNVVQYIGRNPKTAGLPRETWVRWMDPQWESLGWGFYDE